MMPKVVIHVWRATTIKCNFISGFNFTTYACLCLILYAHMKRGGAHMRDVRFVGDSDEGVKQSHD